MISSWEGVEIVTETIVAENIERKILFIRQQKVMLDTDLAALYGVPTERLNEQIKRNPARFPEDFMFQLNADEYKSLRSQIAISKKGRGGRRYLPYVFTEQGIAMLSSVLNSDRAVAVNIEIMRAFVRLREILLTHKDLALKLANLEKRYDTKFRVVFDANRKLMAPTPVPAKRQIGFVAGESAETPGHPRLKHQLRRV